MAPASFQQRHTEPADDLTIFSGLSGHSDTWFTVTPDDSGILSAFLDR